MSSHKNLTKIGKENSVNYDNEFCNLKFSECDDSKYQLWKLNSSQLKEFVNFAKKIEKTVWIDIQRSKGFHYETISNLILPKSISQDIILKSIRVSKKIRIYGYRDKNNFYIVWFDPSHDLT